MIAAAGAAAIVFGALYGEFFGPTEGAADAVARTARLTHPPAAWSPSIIGGCLLVAGYADRDRQPLARGRSALALTAASGVPGSAAAARRRRRGARDGSAHAGALQALGLALGGDGRRSRSPWGCAPRQAAAPRRLRGADRLARRSSCASVLERVLVRATGGLRADARRDRAGRAARGRRASPGRRSAILAAGLRSSSWAGRWRSRSRDSSSPCRRCDSSTTSCSRACSCARVARSGRGSLPLLSTEEA